MLWKKYLWGHISTFYELWILMHTKQLKIMNFFSNVNQNKLYFPILVSKQQGVKIISPQIQHAKSMNLLFFRLICLRCTLGLLIFYRHLSSLAVIRREIRRGNKQGGRSRAQAGAGAACIMAFPPPLSTRPTYQVGWGRHSRQSPPLQPLSNYCSFQRLHRIFATASRGRSRVEKLILESYSDHPLLLPFFDRTPRSRDIDC
jgi:hypothetical protein